MNYINMKMDSGKPTLVTYIDFCKAFDCVQHTILLKKLQGMGLGPQVVEWIGSYLKDRRQRVLANNTVSFRK